MIERCAHGQASETTSRYRPGSTGHRPCASGPSPGALSLSAAIRPVNRFGCRLNSPLRARLAR